MEDLEGVMLLKNIALLSNRAQNHITKGVRRRFGTLAPLMVA
jgi:hypothetical protein